MLLADSQRDGFHSNGREGDRCQCRFKSCHQFTTYGKKGIMIIIRECGIHSCRSPLGKTRGDGQVTIDFFPLHGLSGGCFIGEVPGYFEGWYSGNVCSICRECGRCYPIPTIPIGIILVLVVSRRLQQENSVCP